MTLRRKRMQGYSIRDQNRIDKRAFVSVIKLMNGRVYRRACIIFAVRRHCVVALCVTSLWL